MNSILCLIVTLAFNLAQIVVNVLYGIGPLFSITPPDLHSTIGSFFGCNT